MKKKISKFRKVIGICLLSIIAAFIILMVYAHSISSYEAHAYAVQYLIKSYIDEIGKFPGSRFDLEKDKFLKIITQEGKPCYFVRSAKFDPTNPEEPSGWKKANFKLDPFSISYGANLDNLRMKDNVLQDKMTGQETLLINGPYGTKFPRHLKKTYQAISMLWFEEYEAFNSREN